MNFKPLNPFIQASLKSKNFKVKQAAETLNDQLVSAQEAEEITQPTLHAQQDGKGLNTNSADIVDNMLGKIMPDMAQDDNEDSQFGKVSSSYASDVVISTLPKDTQKDIIKFIPSADKSDMVIQYGMVVDELLPKVDDHNLESAEEHVKSDLKKSGRQVMADKFHKRLDVKYILLMNDRIIDGHHHLAIAKILGVSNSLKVLDLSPVRFQAKTASLFHKISHGLQDNGRKIAA